MALNFVIPTSICLEFCLLLWQILLHVYTQSGVAREIWFNGVFQVVNEIFFGSLLFMYLASFYWAFYFWPEHHQSNRHVRNFRKLEGAVAALGGGLCIVNSIFILLSAKQNYQVVDQFETRMVGASTLLSIFALIDGYLYFLPPSYELVRNSVVMPAQGKTMDKVIVDGLEDFPTIIPPLSPSMLGPKKF